MSKGVIFSPLDGSALRIGLVISRWNTDITNALRNECRRALKVCGVPDSHIEAIEVPGAYELPLVARHLVTAKKVDAVICLGCLIKGETMHFEYIAEAVSQGVMRLNLDTGVPVIFGVLTCLTEEQARARCVPGDDRNHPYLWGLSAVEMALLAKTCF